jgi:hypothetical protein
VDAEYAIHVADTYNNGIIKWMLGELNGRMVILVINSIILKVLLLATVEVRLYVMV